ncbi:MAG: hypothetical protein D4Q77_02910 [Methanothrix sp.]|nr:MAG: hypothetical protein D4Q77_02910 [Methanothrix sp.]
MLLALSAGQVGASVYFKIVEAPTSYVEPDGSTNFTVTIQNLGSKSTYAGLIFRNVPEGIAIVGPRCTKWVDSGTIKVFDCMLRIEAKNISSGNYSFEVGTAAAGAPYSWHRVEVIVADSVTEAIPEPSETPVHEENGGEDGAPEETAIPGLGALPAAAALLIAGRVGRGRC